MDQYTCDQCGYSTNRKDNYKRHLKTHSYPHEQPHQQQQFPQQQKFNMQSPYLNQTITIT